MKIWISAIILGAAAIVVLASQYATVRQLKAEVAVLKAQLGVEDEVVTDQAQGEEPVSRGGDALLGRRVLDLEQRVEELGRTSDYLMERGQAPLSRAKADQILQSLMDPTTSERDRLMAVRLLLRNNMFDDNAAGYVASMLPFMTDSRLKREMIDQLQGATNSVLKAPLLQLAASDTDAGIRMRALQRLGRFADDPQVEQQLWNALRDTEEGVRRSAEGVLRRLPASESALTQARQRGLSSESSIEERFTALSMLQRGNQDLPELAGALAQAAIDSQNPELRLQVLRGFDNVSHPSFLSPLVQSLQDPDPTVRREAADALSNYRTDPVANEWLQHVAQNDTDPRVRHEASDSLGNNRRGGRGNWQGSFQRGQ